VRGFVCVFHVGTTYIFPKRTVYFCHIFSVLSYFSCCNNWYCFLVVDQLLRFSLSYELIISHEGLSHIHDVMRLRWVTSHGLFARRYYATSISSCNQMYFCLTVIWFLLNIDNFICIVFPLYQNLHLRAVKGHFYSQLPHSNLSMFIPYLCERIAWPCYTWGFSNFLQDGSQLNFAALFACCQLSLNYCDPAVIRLADHAGCFKSTVTLLTWISYWPPDIKYLTCSVHVKCMGYVNLIIIRFWRSVDMSKH